VGYGGWDDSGGKRVDRGMVVKLRVVYDGWLAVVLAVGTERQTGAYE